MKTFYIVLDKNGYPYGEVASKADSLRSTARECANLAPGASQDYACRIAERQGLTAEEVMLAQHERAARANTR